eukprot:2641756-Rhodomonas_salina.1
MGLVKIHLLKCTCSIRDKQEFCSDFQQVVGARDLLIPFSSGPQGVREIPGHNRVVQGSQIPLGYLQIPSGIWQKQKPVGSKYRAFGVLRVFENPLPIFPSKNPLPTPRITCLPSDQHGAHCQAAQA